MYPGSHKSGTVAGGVCTKLTVECLQWWRWHVNVCVNCRALWKGRRMHVKPMHTVERCAMVGGVV